MPITEIVSPIAGTPLTSPPHGVSSPSKSSRPWTKWLAGGLLLLIVAAAIGFYNWKSSGEVYTTATVDRGDVEASITATGNCNAVVSVQVGSQVSGNITALYADFNTKVTKGQLVARID